MKNILILGAGTIGKPLADHSQFDLVTRADFNEDMLAEYDALVNCAAITGYGKCKEAGFDAVIEANVALPMQLRDMCMQADIPLFQLSTSGVYRQQTCPDIKNFKYAVVGDPVSPHNLYCASKLLMEQQLEQSAVVLRLPWFLDVADIKKRAQNWNYVQDTWTSHFEIGDLQEKILYLCEEGTRKGIFNISTGVIYFPGFLTRVLNKELEIQRDHAPDMTAAIPIINTPYRTDPTILAR